MRKMRITLITEAGRAHGVDFEVADNADISSTEFLEQSVAPALSILSTMEYDND